MPLVINGDIVVLFNIRNEPIAGRVFISDDQGATINRASINESGEVWFLHKDNIIVPNHSIRDLEKLYPLAGIRTEGGSYIDNSVPAEDNQRVIDWFASKGVELPKG